MYFYVWLLHKKNRTVCRWGVLVSLYTSVKVSVYVCFRIGKTFEAYCLWQMATIEIVLHVLRHC